MRLKRLAQSTVLLTQNTGQTLLVDPGKYNLDPGRLTVETFPTPQVLIITHKHADHFDLELVKAIVARRIPKIITNPEIAEMLKRANIGCDVLADGANITDNGFLIHAIPADHVVRGEHIVNFGIVVSADGVTMYHTSDTRFMEPSMLPAECRADYLLLPISNRGVVMGIDDAAVFASELKPKLAIPLHYDSPKDKDRVDPAEFVSKARKLGMNARVLEFGEEIDL